MLNILIEKIKNNLNAEQEATQMDQAIERSAKSSHVTLLRTDYLE